MDIGFGNRKEEKMKERIEKSFSYFAMVLCPIVMYYLMEAFHMNAFVMTRWRAQILNILCFELGMLFLFVLIGNLKIALIIESLDFWHCFWWKFFL